MLAASPASASTYVTSGQPGASYVYRTGGNTYIGLAYINSNSVIGYRSSASTGTQLVTIRFRVWRLQWGWQLYRDLSTTYTVYPGQYVNFPGWNVEGLPNTYSTDITITWRTATGSFLGSAYRDFIDFSDYECWVYSGCAVGWAGGQYSLWLG